MWVKKEEKVIPISVLHIFKFGWTRIPWGDPRPSSSGGDSLDGSMANAADVLDLLDDLHRFLENPPRDHQASRVEVRPLYVLNTASTRKVLEACFDYFCHATLSKDSNDEQVNHLPFFPYWEGTKSAPWHLPRG